MPLEQLTDHIWYFPADPDRDKVQPAVGVVSDGDETILYDAGNSPSHAQAVIDAIHDAGLPAVTRIIYSHFHWDHIFGAQTFPDDVAIIAHETCRAAVEDYAARPWGTDYLNQVVADNPDLRVPFERINTLITDWDAFQIRLPTQVLAAPTHTLALDSVTLTIEHVGGNHTDDGTALYIKEEGTVFLADCFYPSPASGQDKAGPDLALMQRLLDEEFTYYVDGHFGIVTRDQFATLYALWRSRYGRD